MIGPWTHEDKTRWEFLATMRDNMRNDVAHWKAELETSDDDEDRSCLQQWIERDLETIDRIVEGIGEWPSHHTERAPKYKHRYWNRPTKGDFEAFET